MTHRDLSIPDWATGCQTLGETDFGDAPARSWLVLVGSPDEVLDHAVYHRNYPGAADDACEAH